MMEPDIQQGTTGEKHVDVLKSKRHALLNKFLTKTYHMVDTCDPRIAGWNDDGLSFIIRDVASFADNVLPRYFKHSKFASFVRQLNFYSFRKIRSHEPCYQFNGDKQCQNTVQFAHDFFRKDEPDLLHRITRVTKSNEPPASEVRGLKEDIADVHDEIMNVASRFDQRMNAVMSAVEADYQQRMSSIILSYQTLSSLSGRFISPSHSPVPGSSHGSKEFEQILNGRPQVAKSMPEHHPSSIATPSAGANVNTKKHATTAGSMLPISPGVQCVSDISSNNSATSSSPIPSKCALSVLSGVASAMMEKLE